MKAPEEKLLEELEATTAARDELLRVVSKLQVATTEAQAAAAAAIERFAEAEAEARWQANERKRLSYEVAALVQRAIQAPSAEKIVEVVLVPKKAYLEELERVRQASSDQTIALFYGEDFLLDVRELVAGSSSPVALRLAEKLERLDRDMRPEPEDLPW